MEQDELLEGLRGILYHKPSTSHWHSLRALFLAWPDDELPEVAVDYLYDAGIQALWSKYLPGKGYKNKARLQAAPAAERFVEAFIDGTVGSLRKCLSEEMEEWVREYYYPSGESKEIDAIEVSREMVAKAFTIKMKTRIRNQCLLGRQTPLEFEDFALEDAVYVRLKDGTRSHDTPGFYFSIELDNGEFYGAMVCDRRELMAWAENDFVEGWEEFYDDDWE